MVNLIDVVIIAIALIAALGALALLRPQVDHRDAYRIRKLRNKAEQDQKTIAKVLTSLQHGTEDAEQLTKQLKSRIEQVNKDNQASHAQSKAVADAAKIAKEAETELRTLSGQLEERVQSVQTHWDGQLNETTETIKQLQGKLTRGLTQMDEGLLRLREQEKMAQGFTQKLLTQQQEHSSTQKENAQLLTDTQSELADTLRESSLSLTVIREQQKKSDELLNQYTNTVLDLEQRAQEQFTETFQSIDVANQELNDSLKQARENTHKINEYEQQSNTMSTRVREQFEHVDHLKVDRLSKTIDLTDEMCVNLQQGLENARSLLATLETKTTEVLEASEKEAPSLPKEEGKPRNLFSLRAYQ